MRSGTQAERLHTDRPSVLTCTLAAVLKGTNTLKNSMGLTDGGAQAQPADHGEAVELQETEEAFRARETPDMSRLKCLFIQLLETLRNAAS